jgi:hypothetical protein
MDNLMKGIGHPNDCVYTVNSNSDICSVGRGERRKEEKGNIRNSDSEGRKGQLFFILLIIRSAFERETGISVPDDRSLIFIF